MALIKTLKDLDLNGKRVLMRVDFNVPLDDRGSISDDTRILESLPSIEFVLSQGARLILMSHLGRPKGREKSLSLAPCAKALSILLKKPVQFAPDCIGTEIENLAKGLKPGEVLLLENLRFHPEEEKPDGDFAKKLASLGDLYVNDAFGTAHRAHSSTYEIVKYFPGKAAAGFLMEKEVHFLTSLLKSPKRPFYALIGGAKVGSKMGVLKALISKVDALFIGGGMAFTFFKSMGISIGASIFEEDYLEDIKDLFHISKKNNIALFLPLDLVIANRFDNDAEKKIIPFDQGIPDGWQGMDIGPKTCEMWDKRFEKAATIFWNGPVGVFEFSHFAKGTMSIAKKLAALPIIKIVGGGDSVAAIKKLHLAQTFTHVSTGGGASLELLEKGHLPGIDILNK